MNARAGLVNSWRLHPVRRRPAAEHARRLLQRRHRQRQPEPALQPQQRHRPAAGRRAVRRPDHAAGRTERLPPGPDRVPAGPPQLLRVRRQRGPHAARHAADALTNQINFEFQRLAVLIAAQQIDRNEDIRIDSELTDPGTRATAARDAVSALSDLLDAQNNVPQLLGQLRSRSAAGSTSTWERCSSTARGCGSIQAASARTTGKYDPWLWRTGGVDCPLPQATEVMPAELLPGHREHTEQLPLPEGQQGAGEQGLGEQVPHGQHAQPHGGPVLSPQFEGPPQLEGLPRIQGLPGRPPPGQPNDSLLPPPPVP